jgi:predicted acyltransferase (DUF342 family)
MQNRYTAVDDVQTLKYKQMVGLTNIDGNTNMTTFVARTTILGNIYVSDFTLLYGSSTILSNLSISGISNINGAVTGLSDIYIDDFVSAEYINTRQYFRSYNNINSNYTNIQNTSTIYDHIGYNLTVSGNSTFLSDLYKNKLIADNDSISIHGPFIDIGLNSNLIVYGNYIYENINTLDVIDKIIYLNNTSDSTIQSNGSLSGIDILTPYGNGYIKTSEDGKRYIIKAPCDDSLKYICTVDYNNNLSVSGTTTLYNSTTVFSTFAVANNSILTGDVNFDSKLNTSGNLVFLNDTTVLSSLLISGNTVIQNDITSLGNLNVGSYGITYGPVTAMSSVLINGSTTATGNITIQSDLNIYGDSLLDGNTTFLSELYISGNSYIGGSATALGNLNISNNMNIGGSTEIYGLMKISDRTTFYGENSGSLNINQNLTINAPVIIEGNITYGSSSLYIYSQLITQLPEFDTNEDAILGGLNTWEFYRTGGILKVCLSSVLPVITLYGSDTISIFQGSPYVEPGIIATDVEDITIDVYIESIGNIIFNPKLLVTRNTIIYETMTINSGNYLIKYIAEDSDGNLAVPVYRNLYII